MASKGSSHNINLFQRQKAFLIGSIPLLCLWSAGIFFSSLPIYFKNAFAYMPALQMESLKAPMLTFCTAQIAWKSLTSILPAPMHSKPQGRLNAILVKYCQNVCIEDFLGKMKIEQAFFWLLTGSLIHTPMNLPQFHFPPTPRSAF